jgi:drug/metabolite transporter (DMT)-like permease
VAYRRTWKTWACFAIIYFVWGSTFLAIKVGVREVPPFLLAAMRFLVAGVALFGWMAVRGEQLPKRREWASATLVAALIFVGDYGLLFWAERRVPSGVAAVMMATIPVFMTLSEIVILKTRRMSWRLGLALAVGLGGVIVLVSPGLQLGGAAIGPAIQGVGAAALIFGAICWSVASVLTRRLPLPGSKGMSSGSQMLAGGLLLTAVSAGLGELRGFQIGAVSAGAWWALAYLIVLGSILGFTAYVWLLHHESPTVVGTYAYVNPVVAVLVGFWLGGEAIGLRTVAGMVLVLVSVGSIAKMKTNTV